MSLDLLLAVAGVLVTVMVVAGMFLILPGGVEAAPPHVADPPVDAQATRPAPAGARV